MGNKFIATMTIGLYFLIFPLYIFLINQWRKKQNLLKAKRRFLSGLLNILKDSDDDKICVDHIMDLYKIIDERYSSIRNYNFSASDLLEDIIYQINTTSRKIFIYYFQKQIPVKYKERMLNIFKILKKDQPFLKIKGKTSNLLITLKEAVKKENKALAFNILNQLGDEILILNSKSIKQERKNRYSLVISVIGIIMTIYFGIISIILYLSR